jgi:hypothetical protein
VLDCRIIETVEGWQSNGVALQPEVDVGDWVSPTNETYPDWARALGGTEEDASVRYADEAAFAVWANLGGSRAKRARPAKQGPLPGSEKRLCSVGLSLCLRCLVLNLSKAYP